jgi:hypothetical protein
MQPRTGVRYNNEGIKAVGQFVTPDFELSERAKVPIEFAYLFDEEGLDGN